MLHTQFQKDQTAKRMKSLSQRKSQNETKTWTFWALFKTL